ncbi:hypothetical protein [Haemophilus parahaemolyticus]|uniref:Uncharacterized protein n=1 Tax=Haemophilus parahaemolyticus TaxID=735 RepID=A0A369ZDJ0_HAEPH|nr:hypothetical protein [Haemophilus parahaemolyticus]RDE82755.1 hypothetical protein DPV86_02265 [Haemophilus parahaemolyticus]RDF03923.1 hypothetical protein DPV98_06760 [Haemophilus parahaemolyticus]
MKIRDINHSGKGDIIVQEGPNNIVKKLVECNNEELIKEREFRNQQLTIESKERKRKRKPWVIVCIIILIVGLFYGYYKDPNFTNIINWIYALPGAILSLQSIQSYCTLSEYEKKHLQALREIKDILRERGVEYN